LFLNNLINWINEWKSLIRLLVTESVLITVSVYLILLGIFGVLLGFRMYRPEDEVNETYLFFLLLLLKIVYNNGFDDVLGIRFLEPSNLEPSNIEEFSKFSLQVYEPSNSRPSKLFLGEFVEKAPIPLPFPIIEDPLIIIETEFFRKNPINYEFELFKFYRNVNNKVKS